MNAPASHSQRSSRSTAEVGPCVDSTFRLLYTWNHQIKQCVIAVSAPKRNLPNTAFLAEYICYSIRQPLLRPVCLPASFSPSVSPRQWVNSISPWFPPYGLLSSVRIPWELQNPCLERNPWINTWKDVQQQRHRCIFLFVTLPCRWNKPSIHHVSPPLFTLQALATLLLKTLGEIPRVTE